MCYPRPQQAGGRHRLRSLVPGRLDGGHDALAEFQRPVLRDLLQGMRQSRVHPPGLHGAAVLVDSVQRLGHHPAPGLRPQSEDRRAQLGVRFGLVHERMAGGKTAIGQQGVARVEDSQLPLFEGRHVLHEPRSGQLPGRPRSKKVIFDDPLRLRLGDRHRVVVPAQQVRDDGPVLGRGGGCDAVHHRARECARPFDPRPQRGPGAAQDCRAQGTAIAGQVVASDDRERTRRPLPAPVEALEQPGQHRRPRLVAGLGDGERDHRDRRIGEKVRLAGVTVPDHLRDRSQRLCLVTVGAPREQRVAPFLRAQRLDSRVGPSGDRGDAPFGRGVRRVPGLMRAKERARADMKDPCRSRGTGLRQLTIEPRKVAAHRRDPTP